MRGRSGASCRIALSCKTCLLYLTISVEHSFICPHCGEEISMVLDLSVQRQSYIEDCEVCCKPIEISYTAADGELTEFQARGLDE